MRSLVFVGLLSAIVQASSTPACAVSILSLLKYLISPLIQWTEELHWRLDRCHQLFFGGYSLHLRIFELPAGCSVLH